MITVNLVNLGVVPILRHKLSYLAINISKRLKTRHTKHKSIVLRLTAIIISMPYTVQSGLNLI